MVSYESALRVRKWQYWFKQYRHINPEIEMEQRAKLLGFGHIYGANEDFRATFDGMHAAVEALPVHLVERGRLLNYPQLHFACVEGDIELVKGLLLAGIPADSYPCTEDEDDEPPLVWLARDQEMDSEQKIQIAQLLLAAGADVDEGGALEAAEDASDDDFAQFLRDSGAT